MRSSTTVWKRSAVSQRMVTRCSARVRPMLSTEGCPAGWMARRAPFSSGPQISSVAASNEAGASCRNTSERSMET